MKPNRTDGAQRQVAAGIIIYRRTKDGPRFLLLYHGGRYWNFAKGKVEGEEDLLEGALREIYEETGISRNQIKIDQSFRTQDHYFFRERNRRIVKTVYYFLGEAPGFDQIKISSREHQGYGWFLYRDCARMLMYQNLKNNLKRANDQISRRSLQYTLARPKGPSYNVSGFGLRHRFSPRRPRSR